MALLGSPPCSPSTSACGTDNCALMSPTKCPNNPYWYTSDGPACCSPRGETTNPSIFNDVIMY
eukprot:7962658-Prorocentrum_lima.AAC.1